jgi:hypothetical protein
MGWATVSDVEELTGTTVTAAQLAAAQAVIETVTNRTPAASGGMRDRDLDWLQKATCWQAVWQASQPGFLTRQGVEQVSQDGVSFRYRGAADQLLAPLAQRTLRNCSWMGSRSVRMAPRGPRGSDGEGVIPTPWTSVESWLHSGSDPETGWEDM